MIVCEGRLSGEFKGFEDQDTEFEFYGGQKWRQATYYYHYHYHYAYMPQAKVVRNGGKLMLQVSGMNVGVEVVPA
ncbi:hypothetical protein PseAD21_28690 [Pseudomonas sp. AD21]|nr:hypothetical protein PseAD21_28690 [Pseudomonas sp. AD21]